MKKLNDKIGRNCEQVAALPWRIDEDGKMRILLVTSRTNAKWMLPKGWPMEGRSDSEAALIEAREEAGVDGQASSVPIGSYHYLKLFCDGRTSPSRARIYPVRVMSVAKNWDEKGERLRRWMRPKKAAAMVFEPDLKRFFAALRDETVFHFDDLAPAA